MTSAIVGATGAYYYTWLADGTKVESSDEQSGKKLIYLGSLRYDSSTGEKSTGFAGGTLIVSSVPADSKALLYVKDHLGSVRVIVDKGGRPAVFNEYQPFGLLDKDYSVSTFAGVDFPDADNCWLYNGKEQDVLASSGLLDYGARLYDPALARWISVDPLAESFRRDSPYIYCFNDPINFIDPYGREGVHSMVHPDDDIDGNITIDEIVVTAKHIYKPNLTPAVSGDFAGITIITTIGFGGGGAGGVAVGAGVIATPYMPLLAGAVGLGLIDDYLRYWLLENYGFAGDDIWAYQNIYQLAAIIELSEFILAAQGGKNRISHEPDYIERLKNKQKNGEKLNPEEKAALKDQQKSDGERRNRQSRDKKIK